MESNHDNQKPLTGPVFLSLPDTLTVTQASLVSFVEETVHTLATSALGAQPHSVGQGLGDMIIIVLLPPPK